MAVALPIALRPYQEQDATTILTDFIAKKNENKFQRSLFNAVMGYGKTEVMRQHVYNLLEEDIRLFVIVAPTLAIITQTAQRFIQQDGARIFEYVMFASETIPGLRRTTDERIAEYLENAEQAVIFTTYRSYAKLMTFVHPSYVIFDECHWAQVALEDDVHYLGMTATPGITVFDEIVTRNLHWARMNGIVCDYKIKVIVTDGYYTTSEIAEFIMDHSNKLLILNHLTEEALEVAEDLPDLCEAVIGKHKYEERKEKERRIAGLEKGILSSVNVYREGTDLPWLDSILYMRKPQLERNMLQTLGRIIRTAPGKESATIYFHVDVQDDVKMRKMLTYIRRYVSVLKIHDQYEDNKAPVFLMTDGSIDNNRLNNILRYVMV